MFIVCIKMPVSLIDYPTGQTLMLPWIRNREMWYLLLELNSNPIWKWDDLKIWKWKKVAIERTLLPNYQIFKTPNFKMDSSSGGNHLISVSFLNHSEASSGDLQSFEAEIAMGRIDLASRSIKAIHTNQLLINNTSINCVLIPWISESQYKGLMRNIRRNTSFFSIFLVG